MKYTGIYCRLFLLLALWSLADASRAQSSHGSEGVQLSASNAASVAVDGPDDPQSALVTIRAQVNEVNVLFIATDKHGKFVRDLTQKDFTFLDDHKPPQAIMNFRREVDLPLHLGLLVDVSGSVDSRFDFEQTAATSFLQHTLRAGFDKALAHG